MLFFVRQWTHDGMASTWEMAVPTAVQELTRADKLYRKAGNPSREPQALYCKCAILSGPAVHSVRAYEEVSTTR